MADAIFVDGIRIFNPKDTAPEFIKANLLIKPSELIPWLQRHAENDEIRADLKVSKGGKLYLALNTYKKPTEDDGTRGLPMHTEADPDQSNTPF